MKECVVKGQLKITQGATNVQQIVLGLIDHCLAVLHKRDKMACFVNGAKTLQAYKAMDFPRDFIYFHNSWGKYDELVFSFINTLPQGKGKPFTGSFYFQSKWEPAQLFEKTLLKMAGQNKHKSTATIEVKPCQYLDTSQEIIVFNTPFCLAQGLRNLIRKAMVDQK